MQPASLDRECVVHDHGNMDSGTSGAPVRRSGRSHSTCRDSGCIFVVGGASSRACTTPVRGFFDLGPIASVRSKLEAPQRKEMVAAVSRRGNNDPYGTCERVSGRDVLIMEIPFSLSSAISHSFPPLSLPGQAPSSSSH